MALEGNPVFFRLVRDGEVGLARNARLDLDEVHSPALEHVDRFAPVLRRSDGDDGFVSGLGAVEHRSGDHHARAQQAVRGNLAASLENGVQFAAHIANAGYAIGEEERENEIGSVGGSVIEVHVGMHIPQARDQVFALGIDNLSCVGIAPARRGNAGRCGFRES